MTDKKKYIIAIIVVLTVLSICLYTFQDAPPMMLEPEIVDTPTPTATPIPTLIDNVNESIINNVNESIINNVNESIINTIYDNHSAAWLYDHGFYGNGGGGSSRRSTPVAPISEMATVGLVGIGLIFLYGKTRT